MRSSSKRDVPFQRGFTLVELVTIIVIAGVISVVALPRFFDRGMFDNRAFSDEMKATLRSAQKLAIAQHRNVCAIVATAAPATLTINASSASPGACDIALPERTVTARGNAKLVLPAANTTITFDAMGSPGAASFTLQAAGEPAITVERETGYVH